jgi:hypothetical protein
MELIRGTLALIVGIFGATIALTIAYFVWPKAPCDVPQLQCIYLAGNQYSDLGGFLASIPAAVGYAIGGILGIVAGKIAS